MVEEQLGVKEEAWRGPKAEKRQLKRRLSLRREDKAREGGEGEEVGVRKGGPSVQENCSPRLWLLVGDWGPG